MKVRFVDSEYIVLGILALYISLCEIYNKISLIEFMSMAIMIIAGVIVTKNISSYIIGAIMSSLVFMYSILCMNSVVIDTFNKIVMLFLAVIEILLVMSCISEDKIMIDKELRNMSVYANSKIIAILGFEFICVIRMWVVDNRGSNMVLTMNFIMIALLVMMLYLSPIASYVCSMTICITSILISSNIYANIGYVMTILYLLYNTIRIIRIYSFKERRIQIN